MTWALIIIAAIGFGAQFLFKKDGVPVQDNVIEEAAEDFIEYETGADVDLTPGSPEKTR